jgi:pyruvate, water dikinase
MLPGRDRVVRLFRIMRADRKAEGHGDLQRRFLDFQRLLDANHRVLSTLSELEEKARGTELVGIDYVLSSFALLREGTAEVVDAMVALGGEAYEGLRLVLDQVNTRIEAILTGSCTVHPDLLTLPLSAVDLERSGSVGPKNAQIGEMRNRLGLPVPDGFVITAWAYRRFLDASDLGRRISQRLDRIDPRHYGELIAVAREIRNMIVSSPVPREVDDAIRAAYFELSQRTHATRFALRSSAIGEGGVASFAGQYRTLLGVRGPELVDRYRDVLAGKFSAKAIYYLLTHSLAEADLPMSVGCLQMIDATASGVVYSRDPVRPDEEVAIVTAVLGLGQPLVDGTATPDTFVVSRRDGTILRSSIAEKPGRLVLDEASGTVLEEVPPAQRHAPALGPEVLSELVEYASRLEAHGGGPQDVEWALDRSGRLFLLQTRPLTVRSAATEGAVEPDTSALEVLARGGTTACPGAGAGRVVHIANRDDIHAAAQGCVLVAERPLPELVAAMDRAAALVTECGGVASHMATLAREYDLPTIAGLRDATRLPDGIEVTVDATTATIYAGLHPALISARRRPAEQVAREGDAKRLLRELLGAVAPLNLLHPSEPEFTATSCRTLHDITRFAHQQAMEEMFRRAGDADACPEGRLRLRTTTPLQINLLYLDGEPERARSRGWVDESDVRSAPMEAFWRGVLEEGWPAPPPVNFKGLMSVVSSHMRRASRTGFSEDSYAILGREYLNISLRMGYHFSNVEAMCTAEPNKNAIRIQYKHGGASIERRIRRIRLITGILAAAGFESFSKGDFLDARIAYLSADAVLERLRILGRLAIMTKQLDMALSTDGVTAWYQADFMHRLGLEPRRHHRPGEEAADVTGLP